MRFTKIKARGDDVELHRDETLTGGIEKSHVTKGINPLPELVDGVQAFVSYVVTCMPFLQPVRDKLEVTWLNLKEKDNLRSLQVSVNCELDEMNGKVVSWTTPIAAQSGENGDPDAFVLTDDVMKMIALVEKEAERYDNGETAQMDAFKSSENTKNVNEAMGAASVASTRKPRAQKPATVAGNIGAAPLH